MKGGVGVSPTGQGIQPIAKSTSLVHRFVAGVELIVGPAVDLPVAPRVFAESGESHGGWLLPGHGRAYDNCGLFWRKGCLEVENHLEAHAGKAEIKVIKRTCGRPSCPVCYESWAGKEAGKIEYRLSQWKPKKRRKVVHVVASPPERDWGLPYPELRSKSYKVLKRVGIYGGSCIFHPFREREFIKTWYFSPHFHILGFGWVRDTKKAYKKNGWVVKNLRIRKTVSGTALYQLSHAGVHSEYHTVTWFGCLSYNKLRVRPQKRERDVCSLCGSELRKVLWVGEGDPPVPDIAKTFHVDPKGWVYSQRSRYGRILVFPSSTDLGEYMARRWSWIIGREEIIHNS